MQWLRVSTREIFGLFVDDGAFAAVIVAWLILGSTILPRIDVPTGWKGALLSIGLFVILVESAARRSRK